MESSPERTIPAGRVAQNLFAVGKRRLLVLHHRVATRMSPPLRGRPASTIAWLAAWVVCTLGALALFARPLATPVIEDEIYWVGSAYYYDLAFHQPDWRNPDWDLLPARENPPIAKYVIGASLELSGQRVTSIDVLGGFYALFESMPEAWGRGDDYAKRARVVARMDPAFHRQVRQSREIKLPPEYLQPPRRAMIACAVLTSLLVFLFGALRGHHLTGLLASSLLLIHPAVVQAYNHALSDAVALLFSTAAALLGFSFFRRLLAAEKISVRNAMLLSAATGALLALACGAKMNSLIVVLLLGSTVLALAWHCVRGGERTRAAGLVGSGAATLIFATVIFVVINPAILRHLSDGLVATVREHHLTEIVQARFIGDHLVSIGEKSRAVAALTYFGSAGATLFAAVILAIPFCASPDQQRRFAGWWWLLALLCVTPWIPFPRTRYVLPLVVPSVFLVGDALAYALGLLSAKMFSPARTNPAP
jgi:hypothetical protein